MIDYDVGNVYTLPELYQNVLHKRIAEPILQITCRHRPLTPSLTDGEKIIMPTSMWK